MSLWLKQMRYQVGYYGAAALAALVLFPFVLLYSLFVRRGEEPRLVWGGVPLIYNKYWSNSLRKAGYASRTMMFSFFPSINRADDFDIDVYKLVRFRWGALQKAYNYWFSPYVAFAHAVRRFDIFHHSFRGGFLGGTPLWRCEAALLHLLGKRIVIIPHGEDAYLYSRVIDPALRHALLVYNPERARAERAVQKRVDYWTSRADVLLPCAMIDGMGRWDALPFNIITIDTALWRPKAHYSQADGRDGVVRVVHTPNLAHRGFKGTEFLLHAVEELRAEGLKIELILLEGRQNEEVRRILAEEADILAEQFVATAYATSGIEGMASGLPVMSNLEHEAYTRLFRRYSYLGECPVLSTSPETLKENLRLLVTGPQLREALGRAGRQYVNKYHSEETAQYVFGAIYDKVWRGKEVELMYLFHPLLSEYNRRRPRVSHPLSDNKLPANAPPATRAVKC